MEANKVPILIFYKMRIYKWKSKARQENNKFKVESIMVRVIALIFIVKIMKKSRIDIKIANLS